MTTTHLKRLLVGLACLSPMSCTDGGTVEPPEPGAESGEEGADTGGEEGEGEGIGGAGNEGGAQAGGGDAGGGVGEGSRRRMDWIG